MNGTDVVPMESPGLIVSKINVKHLPVTFFGKLVYYLMPVRRKTVLANMNLVFGGLLTKAEIKRLAQSFYTHLLTLCLENLSMSWMRKSTLKDRVVIIGHENVIKASKENKGILLLTGHLGNWELVPVAGILHFQKFKGRFHILRRTLVNKTVERVLFRRFYEAGLNVIPKKNSLGLVLDYLERNDVVAFIMDQHAKPGKDGILVDFFGKQAGTFKSLAVVARRTGAPVIPTYCYRRPDGKHVMRFLEPLPWADHPDPDLEIQENTKVYNRILENMVMEHPEQWWWVHRRWKSK